MFSHVLSCLGGAAGSGITGSLRFKTDVTLRVSNVMNNALMRCVTLRFTVIRTTVGFVTLCVAYRDTFSSISKPRPECGPRRLLKTYFQAFPSPGQNVGPERVQTHIFKHFQAQARMLAQNASRDTFSSISKARPECRPREVPETPFQAFPSPGQNVSPEGFQRHI